MSTYTPLPRRRQITPWLVLLLALTVLAAVLGVDRWVDYRTLHAQERQHLNEEVKVVGEYLANRLQTTSELLANLRADLPWLLAQPEGMSLLNHRLTALVASSFGHRGLLVVDVNGTVIASNHQELIGMDVRDLAPYQTMSRDANPDTLYVSPPVKTPSGLWVLSLGRVIADGQGRFNGYVLAILTPDYFRLLLSSTLYAPDAGATVIHGEGQVVYRVPDPEGLVGQDLRELPNSLFRRYLDSGTDHLVLEGLSAATGEERMIAFQTVRPERTPADQPLVVAVSRDLTAFFAHWRKDTVHKLGLFALIALVATLSLVALQRRQRAYDSAQASEQAMREGAEEALRLSERHLRLALQSAGLATWRWEIETNELYWSEDCYRLLGFPREEGISYERFLAAVHPDDRSLLADTNHLALFTPGGHSIEYRLYWPDGSLHWISSTAQFHRAADGQMGTLDGIVSDITAQKQAEAQSRLREEHLRLFAEHSLDLIWTMNLEGEFTYMSPSIEKIVGYTFEEFRQLPPIKTWTPAALAIVVQALAEARACADAGRPFEFKAELENRCKDGSTKWLESYGTITDDQQGHVRQVVGVTRDITPRKVAEDALRRSEERYRLIAQNATDVIWTMNLAGQWTYVSPASERLIGYSPQEVMTLPWDAFSTPPSLQRFQDYLTRFHRALSAGASPQNSHVEMEALRKDGTHAWVDVMVSPLSDDDGQVQGIIGVCRDISERKRLEADLAQARDLAEQANAAKSEFLARMSHEIRTPLYSVLGLAQMIGREPLTSSQREMLGRIQTAGESLLAILNDILDMAKIEAGHLPIESRPFALPALLQRLANLYGPSARHKGLSWRLELPPLPTGQLQGDDRRLEQVLTNLIGNAIKFTDQGEIRVRIEVLDVSKEQVSLRFAIQDTGVGIAPRDQPKLFNPFFQVEGGHSRRHGGSGLGLPISQRLIELMGGKIGVDSALDRGSTFWFELPFARVPDAAGEPARTGSAPEPRATNLNGLRVLVVDDSPDHRDLMHQALEQEGAQVTEASDGAQALASLRAHPTDCDLVLMDLQMPVMDGFTATRLIRRELGLSALPIIALTAGVLPEQRQAAFTAGVDAILTKPIDLDEIGTRLSLWGTRSRAPEMAEGAFVIPDPAEDQPPVPPVTPETPGARPVATFPEIVGINRRLVEKNLAGDLAQFRKLLQGFSRHFAAVVAECRADLAAGQRDAAAGRLHRVRGYAGSIGAMAVMRRAGGLEEAIRRGETEVEQAFDVLDQELASLLAAIAQAHPLLDQPAQAERSDEPDQSEQPIQPDPVGQSVYSVPSTPAALN